MFVSRTLIVCCFCHVLLLVARLDVIQAAAGTPEMPSIKHKTSWLLCFVSLVSEAVMLECLWSVRSALLCIHKDLSTFYH